MILKYCQICNTPFFVKPYRDAEAKVCSRACSGKLPRYDTKKYGSGSILSGENHPMWKGGKKINAQGYVLVHSPYHPFHDNQNYVREHRLVYERKLGRYLNKDEVVHHINGVRDDNRIENLSLMLKKEHDSLSSKERPRKQYFEKKCLFCNTSFSVPPSHSWRLTCSRVCSMKRRWRNGKSAFGR